MGGNLMHDFFQQLEQMRHIKHRVSLATLVNTLGMSLRKEGAKMWVGEGGDILGSVTIGGCVDAHVIEQSEAVLAEQTPRLIELPLGDENAWELGLRRRQSAVRRSHPDGAENGCRSDHRHGTVSWR
jgi:xanthine/CO dehydrogenase XdhC/CoxF family maturation factor